MKTTAPTRIASALAGLAFALLAATPLAAADALHNRKVLAALEPFEALTEAALTGNAAKVGRAFEAAQGSRADARSLLSDADAARLDEAFAGLEAADSGRDYVGEALQAAELYKLLVLSLDTAGLTAPIREVNLLDYVGFRITALLRAAPPDWAAIAATAEEAGACWAAIRDRVGDHRLQGRMDRAQKGIAGGAQAQDAVLTRASVQNDLDLVDELEAYFAKK